MNPLAQELNTIIKTDNNAVFTMLSKLGKELFFPKGILTQSSEAKAKATSFNATIGIATDGKEPLNLPSACNYFNDLSQNEIFNYSPPAGNAALRKKWKEHILKKSPSLNGEGISLPVVTLGLTHGLSIAADLFVEAGDPIIVPNQLWGNYRLIFSIKREAKITTYELFHAGGFNSEGLKEALAAQTQKAIVLFNSPNNPTGYAFTKQDIDKITAVLYEAAERGLQIVTLCDDAYYGLFFDESAHPESIFSPLASLHKNILAVKLDGITKEYFAWGFRTAFITFGCRQYSEPLYTALEKKTAADIRGSVSSGTTATQSTSLKMLNDPKIEQETQTNLAILKKRAQQIKEIFAEKIYDEHFTAYPFNAGYFMLIRLKNVLAEELRLHLLDKYGIGTIATSDLDLRIAFSSVAEENIKELFAAIAKSCAEIQS